MRKFRLRLIHLTRIKYLTRKRISYLLTLDTSLRLLYLKRSSEISTLLNITTKKANSIYQDLHSLKLINQIKSDSSKNYIITYFDPYYPEQLKSIPDPPYVLYAKGDINLLKKTKTISVIGTRTPTINGRKKVEHFVKPLVKNNWLIVSGMARGIDSFAHQFALKSNGNTISVLGSGFNHIYPKENKQLFYEIKNKGLVISEYPPHFKPQRYYFPERNRIISGLTKGTIVIESGERSGTLITVDQALDQGREVYVVPGDLFLKQTFGNNKLIQQGGKLVLNIDDIEEDFI